MIVKDLTKTYRSKHERDVVALNNISFSLPETGLVFFVGKSGSDKSTLLNILGGIDSFDKGSVSVFGNELSKPSSKELEKYCAQMISFFFQDYYLLDELMFLCWRE